MTENTTELEKYLIEQYGVIEDKNYLQDVSDIEDYFKDESSEYFDCGQGYYQDEAEVLAYINGKFYEIQLEAEIGSQWMDRGDRLYFAESISSVSYKEIPKPVRKEEFKYIKISENDIESVVNLIMKNGIRFEVRDE